MHCSIIFPMVLSPLLQIACNNNSPDTAIIRVTFVVFARDIYPSFSDFAYDKFVNRIEINPSSLYNVRSNSDIT